MAGRVRRYNVGVPAISGKTAGEAIVISPAIISPVKAGFGPNIAWLRGELRDPAAVPKVTNADKTDLIGVHGHKEAVWIDDHLPHAVGFHGEGFRVVLDDALRTVGAPSTSGMSLRLTPAPEAASFSSWAAATLRESGNVAVRATAAARPCRRASRRESTSARARIVPLLATLR